MNIISKLGRKFVMLSALLFTLGFFTLTDFGSTATGAAPCCSDCFAGEQQCIDNGGDPVDCFREYESCFRWCNFGC